MPDELSSAISAYLDGKNADGYLYSGEMNREGSDRLVELIDVRPDRRPNACLFVATFGGDPNAAYRIGRALKRAYTRGRILAVLGGYCKSAGTLLILCADELAFGCFGELGPLDIQIQKPNEIMGAESGLDLLQALNQITDSSSSSFEQQMVNIIRDSVGAITTKVAAEIASSLTVGLFSPITAHVDPVRLGIVNRAIQIGQKYGSRLASPNVKQGTIDKLVGEYPAHDFVIDQEEAKELFTNVRCFDSGESAIFDKMESILRVPAPDDNPSVIDLRSDFPMDAEDTEAAPAAADQCVTGVENTSLKVRIPTFEANSNEPNDGKLPDDLNEVQRRLSEAQGREAAEELARKEQVQKLLRRTG